MLSKGVRTAVVALAALAVLAGFAAGDEVHTLLENGEVAKALDLMAKDPALVNSVDYASKETPLHVAAHRGRGDAVRWLLARKADPNAVAYNRFTPLHLAADAGIARQLLKAGANPDAIDAWGNTPMQMAALETQEPVVEAILESGHKMDLRTAIALRRREAVKRMIRDDPAVVRDADRTARSNSPLGMAAAQGDLEMVKVLLDAGANVNARTAIPGMGWNFTALYYTLAGGEPVYHFG
jgi:ankyrin repeat protein